MQGQGRSAHTADGWTLWTPWGPQQVAAGERRAERMQRKLKALKQGMKKAKAANLKQRQDYIYEP